MSTRSLRLISALALLSVFGCENEGIPSPLPDPVDTAKTVDTAAPAPSVDEKVEDKAAKADPASDTGDEDTGEEAAKVDDTPGATAKTAEVDNKPDAPKEAEPEPTVGEKKTEGSYAAWLQTSGTYKVNQPGAVVAVVNAQGEFKCNDKYPYKFKVGAAPEGVSFASDTARGASVSNKSTSLRIPFTPTSAGAKNISGTFYFSVCNAETCHIKKQAMSVTVNVE